MSYTDSMLFRSSTSLGDSSDTIKQDNDSFAYDNTVFGDHSRLPNNDNISSVFYEEDDNHDFATLQNSSNNNCLFSSIKKMNEYVKKTIRHTSKQWDILLLIVLTLLFAILCIRTAFYEWTMNNCRIVTVSEVILNAILVFDYCRNIIDTPIKKYFIFSTYGLLNFAAGIPVIITLFLPQEYFLAYYFIVEYIFSL